MDMLLLLLISSDWVIVSFRDGDSMVDEFKVGVSGRRFNGCPEHLDIHSILIDEGAEDVEVLS